MKQLLLLIIFLLGISLLSACIEGTECFDCDFPAQPMRLSIQDEFGLDLLHSGFYPLDSIEFYFFENNERQESPFIFVYSADSSALFFFGLEAPLESNDGNKTFYLQLSEADTDTIFVDVEKVTEDCCSFYRYNSFTYNDVAFPLDETGLIYNITK